MTNCTGLLFAAAASLLLLHHAMAVKPFNGKPAASANGNGGGNGAGNSAGMANGQSEAKSKFMALVKSVPAPGPHARNMLRNIVVTAPADEDISSWSRTVEAVDIEQMGLADTDRVIVTSSGPELDSLGLNQSAALYDFTAGFEIVAIRTDQDCFLMSVPAGLDWATASTDVIDRNDTVVTDSLTDVLLNATGGELSVADRLALQGTNPDIGNLCSLVRILQTMPADAGTFPASGAEMADEYLTSVVTLNSKVMILANVAEAMPTKPRGKKPNKK